MTYAPDICIYHDNCDDGFTAAWAVWKRWGDAVDYRAANYGQAPKGDGIDGKHVLIVDFSYPREGLLKMAERAASVIVLDHHKTAQSALEGLMGLPAGSNWYNDFEGLWVRFDMEKSGARLAWEFCHGSIGAPQIVCIVEDRDLWRWSRKDTKPVTMYLRSIERDFREWDQIALALDTKLADKVINGGGAIERFYMKQVAKIADTAVLTAFLDHEGVAVVHCPYDFVSETCHELLRRHADAPFAVGVVKANGGTTYSLRSTDDRVDVSEIAKANGGGGHRNAAGFRAEEE